MATQQEIRLRYDQAREDAKNGKYAEALEGCLYFLDNSTSAGVRLSYTLSDIMALSKYLPEARAALETRRDRCEALLLDGSGGFSEISDFTSFNKYLDEQDRNLAFLDRLARIPELQELRFQLLEYLWKTIAEQGQYEVLEPFIEAQARDTACHLANGYLRWSFTAEGSDEQIRDLGSLRYQLSHAALAYEVLIALRKDKVAETLARWMRKCDPSEETGPLLAAAAAKARRDDQTQER